ncbi:cyclin-C1-1-like [Rutidosis leptorrhynchoides]|uniref:cyclin-C1-1-like n=1 Tax=Rutidosis leptorrhynchoides TaxID=125765 RepID=UPI003A99957E
MPPKQISELLVVVVAPAASVVAPAASTAAAFPGFVHQSGGLANDTYKMDLILIHPLHLIGLTCIYVASVLKEKDNTAWFKDLRVDMNVVKNIAMEILDFYDTHKMITDEKVNDAMHKLSIRI